MKARTGWVALLAGVALAAGGCGSDDDDGGNASGGTGTSGGAEAMVIGYANPMGSDESLKSIGYGMKEAIGELKLPWEVKETDAKLSADKQVSDIDTLITQNVNGITSWTLNAGGMESVYARANDAEIPVLGYNSESPSLTTNIKSETDSTCAVAQDQAKYIAERIPGARTLMIEGPEVPSITFTTDCFRKAAKAAGLRIIGTGTDSSATEASAQKVAETLLAKYKDQVQAIWTFADHPGAGVSAAVDDAGVKIWTEKEPSGVILVSRDGAPVAMENIERGVLTASWDGNFPQLGAAAVQLLRQHYVDGVPLEQLPKNVVIKATRYDGTNIDEYDPLLERTVELPLK